MPILSLLQQPMYLIGFLLGITIGITVHEFFHAYTAMKLGDYTAKYMGRVSLNPSRHIDPIGLIMLFLAGFGWGKPVPINPNAFKGKYDELKVAIAGPLSNIAIAFIISFFLAMYMRVINPSIGYEDNNILLIARTIVEINILLAVFNIIPIPPLDGSRILKALVPYQTKMQIDKMERSGMGIVLIVILAGLGIISPAISYAISLVYMTFSAVIGTLIDVFIGIIRFLISIF